MCAILDNDVCAEVFGNKRTPAGKGFLDWLDSKGHWCREAKTKENSTATAPFRRGGDKQLWQAGPP